jgi:hypothetical protein
MRSDPRARRGRLERQGANVVDAQAGYHSTALRYLTPQLSASLLLEKRGS